MTKNNRRSNKRRKKIGEVLTRANAKSKWSEATEDRIDRWLVDNESAPDHNKVMTDLFNAAPVVCRKPSREALDTLQMAKRQLGIPPRLKVIAPKIPLYKQTYFQVASAAAVVLVVLGITFNSLSKIDDPSSATTSSYVADNNLPQIVTKTVEGVQKEVVLSDDSRIWVNSESQISYPQTFDKERVVELEGEAYFDVSPDKEKPFVVQTSHINVKVLGTKFNVRENAAESITEVLLHEGAVRVDAAGKSRTLVPGDKLTYHHQTKTMDVESAIAVATTTSDWRTENIFGYQKTIPQLLGMISNYYDVEIVFDTTLFADDKRYSIGFDKGEPADKVLTILSEMSGKFDFKYTDNNSIKIYNKKP